MISSEEEDDENSLLEGSITYNSNNNQDEISENDQIEEDIDTIENS